MAVNKNFVVKNGLEVNTDLLFADSATRSVGVGSTSPNFDLDVRGGIGATDLRVTGFTTLTKDFQVGASGSAFYVSNTNNLVGVGTSVPAFLMDIRSSVSTGQTALYVKGDMRVTGDINLDDLTIDDLTVTGIATYKPDGSGGSPDSWIDIDYTGNTTTGGGTTVGFGSTAYFVDNAKVVFGAGEDLEIYHEGGGHSYIKETAGTGSHLYIDTNKLVVRNAAGDETQATFTQDGSVDLYHNGNHRFSTTHGGVVVAGGSSITGISTILNTTNSSSSTTGALQVTGGVGIQKNLFVGAGASITGITSIYGGSGDYVAYIENPTESGDGLRIRASDHDSERSLLVEDRNGTDLFSVYGAGGIQFNVGVVTASNTTQSSTAANGAFQIKGGASVAKNLFVGGGAEVTGIATVTALLDANGGANISGGAGLVASSAKISDLTEGRVVYIGTSGELEDESSFTYDESGFKLSVQKFCSSADTQSSSTTTGVGTFAGGVGIVKNLFVGGGVKVGAAFTIGTGIGVTTILDDDTFNEASAGALASQQSIKAYVDSTVTAQDLDFQGDSGGAQNVDLDSQTFTISGTSNEIETTGSSQTLTIGLPDDVTITDVLTVSGTTQSSSKDTGTLILQGGAGIEKNLFVGGGAQVASALTVTAQIKQFKAGESSLIVGSSDAGGAYLLLDGDSNGDGAGGDYAAIGQDTSGDLIIQSRNPAGTGDIQFKVAGTETAAVFNDNSSVDLYFNNSKKFETGPAGTIVTGVSTADGFSLGDNEKITFGASEDFKIEHNSDENYIDSNSGHIYIRANVNDDEGDNIYLQPKSGENGIIVTHDGNVELYHNDEKRLETFATGIVVRGGEGADGEVQIYADEGDDNADLWRLKSDTSGIFGVDSYATGSWVNKLQVNPSGAIVSGILTAVGGFNIGIQSGHTLINTGVGNSIGIVTAINFVGSGNTVVYNSSTKTVDIAISGGGGGAGGISTTYQNISSTSATGIATFSTTQFRAASIILSVTQGTSYQAGRYMVIHDGTTPTVVEESAVATGSMLASFDATIGSGNLTFRATMGSSGIATVGIKVDTLKSDAIP